MTIPIDKTIEKIKKEIQSPYFFTNLEIKKESQSCNAFASVDNYNNCFDWLFEQLKSKYFLLDLIGKKEIFKKNSSAIKEHESEKNNHDDYQSFLLSILDEFKENLWNHKVRVFVYGTLKLGEINHVMMKNAEFLDKDLVESSDLFDLGSYPMLVRGKGIVYGEVYYLPLTTLITLDKLEEHPNYYQRCWRHLKSGNYALIYEGSREKVKNGSLILNGKWSGLRK